MASKQINDTAGFRQGVIGFNDELYQEKRTQAKQSLFITKGSFEVRVGVLYRT